MPGYPGVHDRCSFGKRGGVIFVHNSYEFQLQRRINFLEMNPRTMEIEDVFLSLWTQFGISLTFHSSLFFQGFNKRRLLKYHF